MQGHVATLQHACAFALDRTPLCRIGATGAAIEQAHTRLRWCELAVVQELEDKRDLREVLTSFLTASGYPSKTAGAKRKQVH